MGVLLRSFLDLNIYFILFLFLVSVAVLITTSIHSLTKEGWPKAGVVISVFILSFALGILRFHSAEISRNDLIFESLVGQSAKFEGIVVDEPDKREKNIKLTVALNKKVKVLITTGIYSEFSYGDKISFVGKLEKPENFETDTGKIFDYINYLKKDRILYLMRSPAIARLSEHEASRFREALFDFKNYFLRRLALNLAPPKDALLGGILLGAKHTLSEDLNNAFVRTGLVHIVALSGYNISLVADNLKDILSSFLPYFISLWAGIFAIVLFVLLTGAPATAVRAGIMAVLVLFSKISGRGRDITRVLVLAGAIMILVNPYVLVFDASFQLSFLATIAIIYLSPIIEGKFKKISNFLKFREVLATTLSAQIFVLPFLLYKMGLFSILALPINLIILPLIPILMGFGFVAGLAGLVSSHLALPLIQVPQVVLSYILLVVQKSSVLPFAAYNIQNFPLWLTLFLYILLFGYIWKNYRSSL